MFCFQHKNLLINLVVNWFLIIFVAIFDFMKSYFVLILTNFFIFSKFWTRFSNAEYEIQKNLNVEVIYKILQSPILLLSNFGDKSTKLNKNPDAKIEDYL